MTIQAFSYNIRYLIIARGQQVSNELQPLHEPDPVSFSFETIGWKFLGLFLVLTFGVILFKVIQKYQRNYYRREAIEQIKYLEQEFNKNLEITSLNSVFVVLKKTAIISYGREQVAPLFGLKWLQFLESKGSKTAFSKYYETISQILAGVKIEKSKESNEIFEISKKWIKTHA